MNTYIQGISINTGLNIIQELGLPTGFKIGDIKSTKKFPDEAVVAMIRRISKNTRALTGILQQGASYPFAYSSGEITYFWIPVQYTF
jgi:hypothetical protein